MGAGSLRTPAGVGAGTCSLLPPGVRTSALADVTLSVFLMRFSQGSFLLKQQAECTAEGMER